MHLVLIILGSLLAVLIFLLVLALAMPLDVRFSISRVVNLQACVEARAFGKWGPWIRILPGKRKTSEKKAKLKQRGSGSSFKVNRSWREIAVAAKRLISDLTGVFSICDVKIEAEFGTGDPADTGAIYGVLAPLNYSTGNQIALNPSFDGKCLKGTCAATLRFTPFSVVRPILRFGWAFLGPAK